jgi:hypothetical protein
MQTTDAKTWRESIKTTRRLGAEVSPDLWQNVYKQINVALDRSKRMAEVQLSNSNDVMRRQYELQLDKAYQSRGQAVSLLGMQNK